MKASNSDGKIGSRNDSAVHQISVIVPKNPFAPDNLQDRKHCLCALDVEKLMMWWPGTPHSPHRNPHKVRNIQRFLDWKRVAEIAAYLLQEEIVGAKEKIESIFTPIYAPKSGEPGRQWPPRIPKVVGFQRSGFPTFSNVLIHVNGARLGTVEGVSEAAKLVFDESDKGLNFSVIDGQHRINGAYLAVMIRKSRGKGGSWEIPAEIFLDLDPADGPPRHQAQIFIDVNFNQKKVDKSLVADLYPTARGKRGPLDIKERAQDLGRRLMLEVGPLVGLIQIPGIKYGAKDVIALATLNSAIEDVIEWLYLAEISALESQSAFLAQCLDCWLKASGRFEDPKDAKADGLSSENVAYQGRVIISVMTLIPAMLLELHEKKIDFISESAEEHLIDWLTGVGKRAGLIKNGRLLGKKEFKARQYLGTGGLGRFRDALWAAAGTSRTIEGRSEEQISLQAEKRRQTVAEELKGTFQ